MNCPWPWSIRPSRRCLWGLLVCASWPAMQANAQDRISIGIHALVSPYFNNAYNLRYSQGLERIRNRVGGGLHVGFADASWEADAVIEHERVYVTSTSATTRLVGHQRLGMTVITPAKVPLFKGFLRLGASGSFENFAGARIAPPDGIIAGPALLWRHPSLGWRPTLDLLLQWRVHSFQPEGEPGFSDIKFADGWQLVLRIGVRHLSRK